MVNSSGTYLIFIHLRDFLKETFPTSSRYKGVFEFDRKTSETCKSYQMSKFAHHASIKFQHDYNPSDSSTTVKVPENSLI